MINPDFQPKTIPFYTILHTTVCVNEWKGICEIVGVCQHELQSRLNPLDPPPGGPHPSTQPIQSRRCAFCLQLVCRMAIVASVQKLCSHCHLRFGCTRKCCQQPIFSFHFARQYNLLKMLLVFFFFLPCSCHGSAKEIHIYHKHYKHSEEPLTFAVLGPIGPSVHKLNIL